MLLLSLQDVTRKSNGPAVYLGRSAKTFDKGSESVPIFHAGNREAPAGSPRSQGPYFS